MAVVVGGFSGAYLGRLVFPLGFSNRFFKDFILLIVIIVLMNMKHLLIPAVLMTLMKDQCTVFVILIPVIHSIQRM